ncbi:tyrosine-type recombinase/integrase [Streptomyces sp. H27-G5]|uniref:tyrosine-type recombinase/integrase n=1 Tax=Streptomyces sp. H27-G5 TaxID=2996698 RepID=UPI002270F6F5|nr:tyrosine-type recombinase/integrase [Streptomyces sp. H27-G5]MCY0921344.1 tyrosine-type recombinase/integrase [Streptomyces sp. H27-G5]
MAISSEYELHMEACAFLASLRMADRSVNTERVYAGRAALYLSYCAEHGLDWKKPGLPGLARFLHWLVDEPLPPRALKAAKVRFRDKKTANQIMTTVCQFLRFCGLQGWVDAQTVNQLSEQKYLAYLPEGFDPGEDGQFRTVRAKAIKFEVAVEGYEWLNPEQFERILGLTRRARDRFLVALLAGTGARIGEALGLRREDMHLLSNSSALGCQVAGPHVHVRRRQNSNGALAKARMPRSIPVTAELVALYADYCFERDQVAEAADVDMVFVNLFRAPLGRGMTYHNAKDLFDRLARQAGFEARPHMLRHTAATTWIRNKVPRDVVKDLMGHVADASMAPYVHATDGDKREAVERVAAIRNGQVQG